MKRHSYVFFFADIWPHARDQMNPITRVRIHQGVIRRWVTEAAPSKARK